MTSGGNNFNDFPEICQPEKSQAKYREDSCRFLVRGRGAYLLNGPNAAASIHWVTVT